MSDVIRLITLAVLIEGAVEYFVAQPVKELGLPSWPLRYVSLAAGVGAAFGFHADLAALLGLSAPPWLAYVTTGLVIGRGANYTSDILDRLNRPPEPHGKPNQTCEDEN